MAEPIPLVDRRKVQDDPWTTSDANLPPRVSERHVPAVEYQHAENGEHLWPAAEAAALVAWNGSAYSYTWQKGLAGAPVRRGPGLVEITLARPMRTLDHWMACASPVSEGLAGAVEEAGFSKTQLITRIQIYSPTLLKVDRAFLLLVYGVRL